MTEQPDVRIWYARMLLDRGASGDTDRARNLLIEARDAFAAGNMPKQVAVAEQALRECSAPL